MKRKKRLPVYLLTSLLFAFSAFLVSDRITASKESPLAHIETYKIYYDAPTPAIIDEMSEYDVMIIEPFYYTNQQIEEIRKDGTLVYGYINTMEADQWNTPLFQKLKEEDFFVRNSKRVYYEEWDSYLTDITSSHYQKVMADEVQKQIVDKGLDGAFLDTVGNIDNEHGGDPQVLHAQREGLTDWLTLLKDRHPDLSLIQNWGFDTLATASSPYVDGIMWEGFHFSDVVYDEWAQDQVYKLRKVREMDGVEVLTVSHQQPGESKGLSTANRFKHYHEPTNYNEW
ncbi:glycosyl hydrolase [Salimicrobium jeotgali]|uniref:Glycosyl hydrolase n=2 Tax=Salimicrobium TaxID=351195 RepID=K2GJE5_9BACI|nr:MULTISPECIES: endo alpha-1,4 polygalactosaminidase [Salimicrobium]AKG04829.1 glycosyl hydrolase [Salimicrobium jeotgali]EKE30574.1 hypothetical protein MJ3_12899 [Salimicrobium jeotgali]MBM7696805.1 endo-alpha-1,4-polygalactosaminidase (GH114 family) [Salimicrobium jeotgali]SIS46566.1 Glycoside-hydrolase family GH114 [Salimicrobium salexigens]